MPSPFDEALRDVVPLLRALPRERSAVPEARRRFADFLASHPGVTGDLAVDLRPGAALAAYDVLLDDPDHGTVGVTYAVDAGSPWMVDYSEHWAANYVLSVGDAHLTVQDALRQLQVTAQEHDGLVGEMLDAAVTIRALNGVAPPSEPDVQQAADAFRSALGLQSARATQEWLASMGWSEHEFESLIAGGVQTRTLRDQVTRADVEPFFEAHRASFDFVRFFQVDMASHERARDLVESARSVGLPAALAELLRSDASRMPAMRAAVHEGRAFDLPAPARDAQPGIVTEPLRIGEQTRVLEVLDRRRSELDSATREAVQHVLFRRWLDERRSSATVRWHWV